MMQYKQSWRPVVPNIFWHGQVLDCADCDGDKEIYTLGIIPYMVEEQTSIFSYIVPRYVTE
jgi:hypothetical protein